jgi:6-phosphogluconolactonase
MPHKRSSILQAQGAPPEDSEEFLIEPTRRQVLMQAIEAVGASLWLGSVSLLAYSKSNHNASISHVQPKGPSMHAYIGSRTTRERNARGEGITVCRVDPQSGTLERTQLVTGLVNPSYLTVNRGGKFLYAVHGDESSVSAFKIDRSTGHLELIGHQSTQGGNPVHLTLDPTERFLLVANYAGSSLAVLPVAGDGTLLPVSQLVTLSGPVGPHRIEQTQSRPHFTRFDPAGKFVLVPDKGLDRVFSFRFDAGILSAAAEPFVATREAAGPRHLAFHPHSPLVFVSNELDSTVTVYRFTAKTGALQPIQRVSSLPDTFVGDSRAAGIAVDATGRILYASNRGHDSIAVFGIHPESGMLNFIEAVPTQGKKPRFFTLSPSGRLLYALNEDSHTVANFAVNERGGRLTPTGASFECGSPVCMVFSH